MKSFKSTLALLGVLALLIAWYAVYENKLRPQQKEQEENSKLFISTPREAIQEITVLQRQGEPKDAKYRNVTLKKTGTDWNLTSPLEDLADSEAVDGILSTLTTSKQDRVVDEKPADLEPFGLKTPKLKILVKKDSASPPQELWIGDDTTVGAGVYAKLASEPQVYRGAEALRSGFEKDPSHFRNKKILTLSRPDISEMEVRTGGENFVLKRTEGEHWTLAREGLPASVSEVNKLIAALVDLKATGFATEKTDALGKFGLAPAGVTISVKQKDATHLLMLGKVGDKYYAKRADRPVVFEVAKDAYDKAARPAKDFRDLKLSGFNRFNIRRVVFERGKDKVEFTKPENDWKLSADVSAAVDNSKVEDYLSRLQDIKVTGFSAAGTKLTTTDLTVRLFEKRADKETEALTLNLQKPAGKQALGMRSGLDRAFTLSEEDFKKVNAFKQEFLQAEKPKKE